MGDRLVSSSGSLFAVAQQVPLCEASLDGGRRWARNTRSLQDLTLGNFEAVHVFRVPLEDAVGELP